MNYISHDTKSGTGHKPHTNSSTNSVAFRNAFCDFITVKFNSFILAQGLLRDAME